MTIRLHIDRLIVDERLLDARSPREFERDLVAAVRRRLAAGDLDAATLRPGARDRVQAPVPAAGAESDGAVERLASAIVSGVGDG